MHLDEHEDTSLMRVKSWIEAIIFDGDDTLWQTQRIYDEAKEKFYHLMVSQTFNQSIAGQKLNRQIVAAKLAEIDVANVAHLGFAKIRFAKSMTDVYKYFCEIYNQKIDAELLKKINKIGTSVFNYKPTMMDDARDVLNHLKTQYRLYLYTAGDRHSQEEKIKKLDISIYFDAIYILDRKNEVELHHILTEQKLDASRTFMVGNSIRSDINPALRVGLPCIWLRSSSWEYDEANLLHDRVWQVDTLREILPIIEHPSVIA